MEGLVDVRQRLALASVVGRVQPNALAALGTVLTVERPVQPTVEVHHGFTVIQVAGWWISRTEVRRYQVRGCDADDCDKQKLHGICTRCRRITTK